MSSAPDLEFRFNQYELRYPPYVYSECVFALFYVISSFLMISSLAWMLLGSFSICKLHNTLSPVPSRGRMDADESILALLSHTERILFKKYLMKGVHSCPICMCAKECGIMGLSFSGIFSRCVQVENQNRLWQKPCFQNRAAFSECPELEIPRSTSKWTILLGRWFITSFQKYQVKIPKIYLKVTWSKSIAKLKKRTLEKIKFQALFCYRLSP